MSPRASCFVANPPQLGTLTGAPMRIEEFTGRETDDAGTLLEAPETESHYWSDRWGVDIKEPFSLSTTFRHSGWVRERLLIYQSLHRTEQKSNRIREFEECGSHAYVLKSVTEPDSYRLAGSACHDRFCLPCATERSQTIAMNVMEAMGDRECRFLTLTIRSTDESLASLLDKLYNSFTSLRRSRLWKRSVTGGVAFVEINYRPGTDRWHPHFHVLIEGKFIRKDELKRVWHAITGDSFIIDIRMVKNTTHAARYVTKYASKPFNNTYVNRPDRLDEAVLALKGRKLALTFGSWRGVTLARTISDGAWEHYASLDEVIHDAAHGDTAALRILEKLTDQDLQPLLARAPPRPQPNPPPLPAPKQLTWFGTWSADRVFTVIGTP